ncbi:MAG: threonine synthase [Alphaproteobacteria bacterium]|nr:threonine synthase [Alphaproteobacteria bacterium]
MRYISTRGRAPSVSFADAVLAGLAPDGGLYVPETWPTFPDRDTFKRCVALGHYTFTAYEALNAFSGALWEASIVNEAYLGAKRPAPQWPLTVAPLVHEQSGTWILELFHGPSLAFKDIAMQLIGPLYEHLLSERNERLTVLCATSGDTGGAAVEALKNRERIDLFVLLPKGRVSDVQRRFMTTSGAANVHTLELDADFDACQAILKQLFADRDFADRARLSAVNSVNWARITAQCVYFHIASQILCAHGPVSFVVPTGNFGDALSGFVAKQMGAPIGRIGVAVNANDIVARALHTGRYERAPASHATLSPAMDIQVPSNFERILFEALDRDADHLSRLYDQFAQSGAFDIPADALAFLRDHFDAASVSDADTRAIMQETWEYGGYLACPHTAVAMGFGRDGQAHLDAPVVTLATAHPAKFPDTVEAATGLRPPLPPKCADLFAREEKFDALPADIELVKAIIRDRSRAWT